VANPLGLTLRDAAGFVVLARQFRAEVLVFDGARQLSGKSLVALATLVAPCGTQLDVEARGPDAKEAVAALAGLVASRSRVAVPSGMRTARPAAMRPEDGPRTGGTASAPESE
jgi:phosphocarrier protein